MKSPLCMLMLMLVLAVLLLPGAALAAAQADLTIRNDGDLAFLGSSLLNATGAEQTVYQEVVTSAMATYQVVVTNQGDAAGALTVTGSAGGNGWTVRYFDAFAGGHEITSWMIGAGWPTGTLQKGASRKIRVEVTRAAATSAPRKDVLITATTPGGSPDTVRALAVMRPSAVEITGQPAYGSGGAISGRVRNIDPATHYLVAYIYVNGWWVKPFADSRARTPIQSDGSWSAWVTTGGQDQSATRFAVFALPATSDPPILSGAGELPAQLYEQAAGWAVVERPAPGQRVIAFSGYDWEVKNMYWGPGPNYFSNSADNVWLDDRGLHLRVTQRDGTWYCAEVSSRRSLGLGTYRFYLDSPVDHLDPSVVLGCFTYDMQPSFAHREIDIEFARWGNAADPTNAQSVLQPFEQPNHLHRYTVPADRPQTTHEFLWAGDRIDWQSRVGHDPLDPTSVFAQWALTDAAAVPPPGDEKVHMNLWLYNTRPPTNGQEAEVVIKKFEFIPLLGMPDLQIRALGTSAFTGDGIINETGENQLITQTAWDGTPLIYELRLRNRGKVSDRFRLTGAVGDSNWTVHYYDSAVGGNDITAQVIDAGWVTPSLPADAIRTIRLEVIPRVALPGDALRAFPMHAVSVGDPDKRDTVQARVVPLAPLTKVSFTIAPASPVPAQAPVTLTASKVGGLRIEYRFRAGYQDAAGWHWEDIRPYNTAPVCTWTPTTARLYTLAVYAREVGNTSAYQVYSSAWVTVAPALTAVSLAATPAAPQRIGTPIGLTASATGGARVQYRFCAGLKKNGVWTWVDIRGYAAGNSCQWTPTAPGSYLVAVYVREAGTVAYQAYTTLTYHLTALTGADLTVAPVSPRPVNTPITLTASAIGWGEVEYRFRVGKADTSNKWQWTTIRDYASSPSCQWLPGDAGTYTLVVDAREVGSTLSYVVYKSRVFTITQPMFSLTSIPAYGSVENLYGTVTGLTPSAHYVAVYIKVNGGWWSKPLANAPRTSINAKGEWVCDITTGGQDAFATHIAVFVLPNSFGDPPIILNGGELPAVLYTTAVAFHVVERTPN